MADKMKQRPGRPTAGAEQRLLLWGHGPEDTGPRLREASAHCGGTHRQAEQGERVFLHRRASIVEGDVNGKRSAETWRRGCPEKALSHGRGQPRETKAPRCTRGRRWEKPCQLPHTRAFVAYARETKRCRWIANSSVREEWRREGGRALRGKKARTLQNGDPLWPF